MEKYLADLFKAAEFLNSHQDKVVAQIIFLGNRYRTLAIHIRTKTDYSIIEKCEIQLKHNPYPKIKAVKELFNAYIGGVLNE